MNPSDALDRSDAALEAVVRDLCAFARANPLNIKARIAAGLGPPLGHRRDFTLERTRLRVLLTEERIGRFWGRHLSVMGLDGPVPEGTLRAVVEAFLPASERPVGADLLEMPSRHPHCHQFISVVTSPETGAHP